MHEMDLYRDQSSKQTRPLDVFLVYIVFSGPVVRFLAHAFVPIRAADLNS
uniref:Uncharacterized protein n=1 Tax=Picea glauca TaxID=3330 RepID=A0A101M0R5_PICGL|nr:hypothetical protein ABT39_MTgene4114 [Picea glauca]QHR92560.1 hypothetical protein Q903MT_gene6606 [Picea sitchensis]